MGNTKRTANQNPFHGRLKDIVLRNLCDDQFGVAKLASEIGMSRSQLCRKVRHLLHKTVNEYIREIRLQEAMKLLKSEEFTAAEISYKVGFSAPTYFNKCFHDYYGFPPGECKKLKLEGKLDDLQVDDDKTGIDSVRSIDHIKSKSRTPFSRKMSRWILLLFLVFLSSIYLLFNQGVFQVKQKTQGFDKSIVVLPFRNDSSDPDNEYFCNGIVEEILDKLQNIGELKVFSKTATEQYRNTALDPRHIARELNVNHILQGSVRKWENKFRVSVQLINAKTGFQIWSDVYEKEMEDVFAVQADIALKVSEELKLTLTTNEKQQIVSTPTTDVTAYDYMLQARQEQWKYWRSSDTIALKRAEMLYNKVLKLYPEYALVWVRKGSIYMDRLWESEEYFEKNYLDSVLWYCDKAIAFNPEYGGAYLVKGIVFHGRGNIELAIKNYEITLDLSQNDPVTLKEALWRLGYINIFIKDYINGISLIRKAVQEARGSSQDFQQILFRLGYAYMLIGEHEKAKNYLIKSRNLGGRCFHLCLLDAYQGNFQASINCISTCCRMDTPNFWCNYNQANNYLQLKEYETSVKYFQKIRKTNEELGRTQWDNLYREGFALMQMGDQVEGLELIEKQLAQLEKRKILGRPDGYDYHLAAIYASRGDQERALKHLRNFEKKVISSHPIINLIPLRYIQHDIMFENLWGNEEFKTIIKRNQEEMAAIRAQVREMEERDWIYR